MEDKTYVFDKPIVTTQRFEVSHKGQRYLVERKEVFRQAHNTACDVEDTWVEHKVWIEDIDMKLRQEVVEAVEKEVEANEK